MKGLNLNSITSRKKGSLAERDYGSPHGAWQEISVLCREDVGMLVYISDPIFGHEHMLGTVG